MGVVGVSSYAAQQRHNDQNRAPRAAAPPPIVHARSLPADGPTQIVWPQRQSRPSCERCIALSSSIPLKRRQALASGTPRRRARTSRSCRALDFGKSAGCPDWPPRRCSWAVSADCVKLMVVKDSPDLSVRVMLFHEYYGYGVSGSKNFCDIWSCRRVGRPDRLKPYSRCCGPTPFNR